eukprot:320190_1
MNTQPKSTKDRIAHGMRLFQNKCQKCHAHEKGKSLPNGGPHLFGVVGRIAGASKFNYSPALKQSGIVWTRDNLIEFLINPRRMIPGNTMFFGASTIGKLSVESLVCYLESISPAQSNTSSDNLYNIESLHKHDTDFE